MSVNVAINGFGRIGRNVLRPQIEYRIQSIQTTTPSELSGGHLFSISARYQLSLGERYAILPALRFDTGNQKVYNGATVGFTGWGLSVGMRATI